MEENWHYLGDIPYQRQLLYNSTTTNDNNNNRSAVVAKSNNPFDNEEEEDKQQQQNNNLKNPFDDNFESDFEQVILSGAPMSGPTAKLTIPIITSTNNTNTIRISSSSIPPSDGNKLSEIILDSSVMALGWTSRWVLLVFFEVGCVEGYSANGQLVLPKLNLLEDLTSQNSAIIIKHVEIFSGGAAVVTNSHHCVLLEMLDEHDDPNYIEDRHVSSRVIQNQEVIALVTPLVITSSYAKQRLVNYTSVCTLPRFQTPSGRPEVFLATSTNTVLIVDSKTLEITDVECQNQIQSPIIKMSFAPNGRFLACVNEGRELIVLSTSFDTQVLRFDCSSIAKTPPKELAWCGEDSIALHWQSLGVILVGPYGDWLQFSYEDENKGSSLKLVGEIDSCRVVTDVCVEILQRVAPNTADIFQIGSIVPGALLLDASDAFTSGSSSSDEASRAIVKSGKLGEAISECIAAALTVFDVPTQKRLLRAASYGMHFSYKTVDEERKEEMVVQGGKPTAHAKMFVVAAQKLRIINALREKSVGFPLTSAQYDAVTPVGLIARLVAMNQSTLATSICSYLDLDESVYTFAKASRATAFVTSPSNANMDEEEMTKKIIEILNEDNVVAGESKAQGTNNQNRYSTVALAAYRAGRKIVARKLIKLESSIVDKVPALIAIGAFADAANVAGAVKDADLLFHTLEEFEKHCRSVSGSSDQEKTIKFLQRVATEFPPDALNVLKLYYNSMNDSGLRDMLMRAQNFTDAGCSVARRSFYAGDKDKAAAMLREASQIFGLGKESGFQRTATDEYLELMADTERLSTSLEVYLPKTSSVTTLFTCIIEEAARVSPRRSAAFLKEVDSLAKKYKIGDKRLYHIKVRAFIESGQWQAIHTLAEQRKSPIGYAPFAKAMIKGRQSINEIVRYTEKVTLVEERYELFYEAKLWKRAAVEASKLKDPNRIMDVKNQCATDEELQRYCNELLASYR